MTSSLIRCSSCGTLNKISNDKLSSKIKCGKCHNELRAPSVPVDVTPQNFTDEVLKDPGTVLLDFWSTSCGYCRMLNPVLDELAREKAGQLKIAKANIAVNQILASHFGIRGVPTLVLFRHGQKINQLSGYVPKQQLLAWINSSL